MRCLKEAAPAVEVDAREVDRPSEGEELQSPYVTDEQLDLAAWAHDAFALAAPAKVLCREDCAGPVPDLRRGPERGGPRARAREPAGPALGEVARAEARIADEHRRGACAGSLAEKPLPFWTAMAVPKKKQSHSRTAKRRAQHRITPPGLNACPTVPQPAASAPGLPGLRQLRRP